MQRGSLFIISGPAGAGKSKIVKRVLEKHPDVFVSVSCTTREKRPGEQDGVDYHYVSEKKFDELISQDSFFEWAHVHQNRYGTLKSTVDEELSKGRDLILEINVQGGANAKKADASAVSIFVCPPSRENLEKRLVDRGTESAESLRVRLNNVAGELREAYKYDYVIIHQDWNEVPDALDIAAEEVYSIIRASRCAREKRLWFLDSLGRSLSDGQD